MTDYLQVSPDGKIVTLHHWGAALMSRAENLRIIADIEGCSVEEAARLRPNTPTRELRRLCRQPAHPKSTKGRIRHERRLRRLRREVDLADFATRPVIPKPVVP